VAAEGGYYIPDGIQAEMAKATLGTSAATGSVLFPGAAVGELVKPPRSMTAAEQLVTDRPMDTYGAVIPVRATTPTRAAVVAWGQQKTLTNLAYGSYTATPYTLAIIYDLAKQFIRYSRGAAEADVRSELAEAFRLGRSYYILQGSGSSEPYGIQTAIGNAFSAYTTSFSPSGTTLAGSIAKAIASAAGDLSVRNWTPEAALLGPAAYWNMVSQGTDEAGFFFAPTGGPTQIRPGTIISPFGIPVYAETQLAGTDDLLVGTFSAVELYRSTDYRVDVSDTAYDRFDKNLVGFRGEEEIGLDARAAVFAGAFQFVADIVP
jgi:HK97 family phage major capsid protein